MFRSFGRFDKGVLRVILMPNQSYFSWIVIVLYIGFGIFSSSCHIDKSHAIVIMINRLFIIITINIIIPMIIEGTSRVGTHHDDHQGYQRGGYLDRCIREVWTIRGKDKLALRAATPAILANEDCFYYSFSLFLSDPGPIIVYPSQ